MFQKQEQQKMDSLAEDFVIKLQLFLIEPPIVCSVIPFDLTSFLTAKQIQTQYKSDIENEESRLLFQKSSQLIRVLSCGKSWVSGNQSQYLEQDEKQQPMTNMRKPNMLVEEIRAQVRLQMPAEIKTQLKWEKYKNENEDYINRKHKKDEQEKQEKQKQTKQAVKKANKCGILRQARVYDELIEPKRMRAVQKDNHKIVELIKKQYRIQPEKNQVRNPINDRPSPNPSACFLQQESDLQGNMDEKHARNFIEKRVSLKTENRKSTKQKMLFKLKEQFSSICCHELNEEEKRVSDELKELQIRLGEFIGHSFTPAEVEAFEGTNQQQQCGASRTRTVRLNLTPVKINHAKSKSDLNSELNKSSNKTKQSNRLSNRLRM